MPNSETDLIRAVRAEPAPGDGTPSGNGPSEERPRAGVPAMVAEHVRERPQALALSGPDGELTYDGVHRWCRGVVAALREHGVRPAELVAVRVPPSARGVCAMLGVLQAGGVLLPLDPSQPPLRQNQIVEDAGVRLLIGEDTATGSIVVSDTGAEPRTLTGAPDAAYVIYTSGSTGLPKGVVCRHSGLANIATAQRGVFGVEPADRVAQIAPWCVDASLFEITLALTAGASLHIAAASDRHPGPPLERFLTSADANVLVATPSTLAALRPDELPSPRLVISAGEELPPDVARAWAAGRRLVNAYGVTEGSIWTSYQELPADSLSDADHIPLGTAIPGCRISLRDAFLKPVPAGETGEICIEGAGVAAGYLDREELTDSRFAEGPSGRLFLSGDLATYDASGGLRFLGRKDDQVKLGGMRVELGEVRHVLSRCPAVRDCAVRPDNNRLVAYVVARPGHDVDRIALTEWMEERVPLQMVPSLYIPVAELPMTAWGKLDVAGLPQPTAFVAVSQEQGDVVGAGIETDLSLMVSDILGVPKVLSHDDLFMLGLTSLSMARLMTRVLDELSTEIDPVDVFERPTVAELAELIDQRHQASA